MTQDDIRNYLSANQSVYIQVASPQDGSPEAAWGDTFVFLKRKNGELGKMPFITIVTSDYEGFDYESNLNRPDIFRLNMDVGREKFAELFSFTPKEFSANRSKFDFSASDVLFPHPVYGEYGWASVISPRPGSVAMVKSLLDYSLHRAGADTAV
ncbi:DUF6194 family protein [Bowmanella denitrificans]|uniref:DUF6194 family protein n=1 Tax=Bowmanella denitrificans TaxID=366582 RepID=A0ABP3GI21_9ALTE